MLGTIEYNNKKLCLNPQVFYLLWTNYTRNLNASS